MNQAQLAKDSGISQATLSRIESEQVEEVTLSTLRGLAEGLGVPLDFLMGRTAELTISDWVEFDPNLRTLLYRYLKLSSTRKEQLLDFALFLVKLEPPKENGNDIDEVLSVTS